LQKNNSRMRLQRQYPNDQSYRPIGLCQSHIWYLLMPLASKSGLGTHLVWDDIPLAVEPCVGGAHHQWMDWLQAFLMCGIQVPTHGYPLSRYNHCLISRMEVLLTLQEYCRDWQDLHDDDKTCMQSSYWELVLENGQ
jgi:hypothetical protein